MLQRHLGDQPSQWTRLAYAFAEQLARFGIPATDNELNQEFADSLLEELIDPGLLYHVILSKTDHDAADLLAELIAARASQIPIQLAHSDEDVVEREGQILLRRQWREHLHGPIHDEVLVWQAYSAETYEVDARLARSILSRLLEVPSPAIAISQAPEQSVFRLDVIDLALYQTLRTHPDLLHALHWRTFEKLLADILDRFGYEVELTQGSKDGGVDLFALKRAAPLGPERYIIQAKRWTNAVGVEPVRDLLFLHSHHRATKSCLVTTAKFTRGAWELANQYRWQLELRDFDGLLQWVDAASKLR